MKAFPHVLLSRSRVFSSSFLHKITPFMALSQIYENALFLVSATSISQYQFFAVKLPRLGSAKSSGFASRMETEL